MKAKLLTIIFIASALQALADVPSGYYRNANGKKDADLKTALCNIIYNHTEVSSYSDLPKYFQRTDVYPQSSRWWDMYSADFLYAPSFKGLNREHSFPKSWWKVGDDVEYTPAYVDLNHLYPAEAAANMAKSNYPLGTVAQPKFNNGVTKVGYAVSGQGGGASQVFEPDDEYKGDFARTYFYMVTCYQNLTWNKSYMWMLQQNTYPTLTPWAVDLLLKWNDMDPVSEKEKNRNEEVYKIQNNRNPFIDYPILAEYIWGSKKGELFYEEDASQPIGTPTLITPVQNMSLDFNQVAVGNTVTSKLYFRGEFLTGSLSIAITGTDKTLFSVSTKSIASSLVNAASGYWLTVTYKPTATGSHQARLIVSDGGLTGSLGVALIGESLPVPTLTSFTALPPTEITSDSYVANWDEPTETVDYYKVSRTRYINGNAQTEDLVAEVNSLLIEDYNPSVRESYNVRSVRLGYESPRSNEIFVDPAGIEGISGDKTIGTAPIPGGVRFITNVPVNNARIIDMQGRMLINIDVIDQNLELPLPAGIYILTWDGCTSPVKIISR